MKKRYHTGVHEVYDLEYIRLKNASAILGNGNSIGSAYNILFDKRNCEAVALEIGGNDKGVYFKQDVARIAGIPYTKNQLKELAEEWESFKKRIVREGYGIPTDEQMPIKLQDRKYILESRLDILEEELVKINDKLKTFVDKEEEESTEAVLKNGLMCCGSLRDGVLNEIDNQNCKMIDQEDEEEILCIVDNRSIYNFMSVSDYRKLAAIFRASEIERDVQELKRIQAEQKRRGLPISQEYSSYNRVVPKEDLPAWPAWAINHKIEKLETETKK